MTAAAEEAARAAAEATSMVYEKFGNKMLYSLGNWIREFHKIIRL